MCGGDPASAAAARGLGLRPYGLLLFPGSGHTPGGGGGRRGPDPGRRRKGPAPQAGQQEEALSQKASDSTHR